MKDGPAALQADRSDETDTASDVRDAVDNRIALTPPLERPAVVVEHLAPGTSGDSLAWIAEAAAWAERFSFSTAEIRSVATELAGLARTNGQRIPGDAEWTAVRGMTLASPERRILTYAHGQRLRLDFKFTQLHQRTNEWLTEFGDDALVLALAAFGALGMRASNGLDLLSRAVEAQGGDMASHHVCLAALGFADHVEGQAKMILSLSDAMMARGESGGDVCFRRARAFRKLGQYDDALAEIDRAMDRLDTGQNLVHEQYVQERFAIVAAQDMYARVDQLTDTLGEEISKRVDERIAAASSALDERITNASEQLAQRVTAAHEVVSGGVLKMVEVLGVFVTLAGFLVGSGTVVVKARTFDERAVTMALVVVGSVAFFGLLRIVTGSGRRKRAR